MVLGWIAAFGAIGIGISVMLMLPDNVRTRGGGIGGLLMIGAVFIPAFWLNYKTTSAAFAPKGLQPIAAQQVMELREWCKQFPEVKIACGKIRAKGRVPVLDEYESIAAHVGDAVFLLSDLGDRES